VNNGFNRVVVTKKSQTIIWFDGTDNKLRLAIETKITAIFSADITGFRKNEIKNRHTINSKIDYELGKERRCGGIDINYDDGSGGEFSGGEILFKCNELPSNRQGYLAYFARDDRRVNNDCRNVDNADASGKEN